jgi:hypothetical protein
VRGTRAEWINDICRRIQNATGPIEAPKSDELPSYERIIEGLAAKLQPVGFVDAVRLAWTVRAQVDAAYHSADAFAKQVSFWDEVNVFSDTDAERHRDGWLAHAAELRETSASAWARMNRLLDEALESQPALALYEWVVSARVAVSKIHARSEKGTVQRTKQTFYRCVLRGRSEALSSLEELAQRALKLLGPLPTPSDALEAWVRREL